MTLLTAGVLLFAGHPGATADVTPDAIVATVDPVSADADILILGAAAEDHLSGNGAPNGTDLSRARAIATGDFNNDGAADIIIGAPDADVVIAQPAETRTDAGTVYIIFGRTTPFTSPIDTSVVGQTSIRILGREAGDRLGFAVAAGDVNGDDIDDIIIGAPGADFNDTTRVNTGAVFVIHGAANIATSTVDLNAANAPAVVVHGVATGDL
ncbi:MAG TPA: FG-GAP repeat protein, partial [Blastocatellia bacterium]|nr:FG-GAP repeat protein [Blastocatellia bacterium]